MSRAFVKEIDDAPEPPLADRPVSTAPNRVTRRGARQIEDAVASLQSRLAMGIDASMTPALKRDLRYWSARLASRQIVECDDNPTVVGFGAQVTIRRGQRISVVRIVGEDEADPATGRIAWTAPLARALEGAEAGEDVEMDSAGRSSAIHVVRVEAGDDS